MLYMRGLEGCAWVTVAPWHVRAYHGELTYICDDMPWVPSIHRGKLVQDLPKDEEEKVRDRRLGKSRREWLVMLILAAFYERRLTESYTRRTWDGK
jgi:hypothetical protein